MSQTKSFFSNALAVYASLAVFVLLLYGYTLTFSYAGDDEALIKLNKSVQNGFSSLPDLLTKSTFYGYNKENFGAYRPLTMVSFAVEVGLWGNKPALSHLVNVLLYILCGCLLYRWLTQVFRESYRIPFLITLLFLAHPVHSEVVANIKSRDEILALLFGLLIPLLLLSKEERRTTDIVLAYLSFFAGLLAKENALTFFIPIVAALYYVKGITVKETIYTFVPFALLSAAYLGLRAVLLDPIPDVISLSNTLSHCHSVGEKVGTVCFIALSDMKLLLFPFRLSWDHSFSDIPVVPLVSPGAVFSAVLHLSLLIYAILNIGKRSLDVFLIVFYFATLFLFLNIAFPLSQNMAERFLFTPTLPFCIALVLLLNWLSKKLGASPNIVYGLCGVVVIFYSVRTIQRNPVWKNNETFFLSAAKDAPNSFHAHQSVGMYLSGKADQEKDATIKTGLYTRAMEAFERSVLIYPGFQENWYMLGRCAQLVGENKRAEQAYEKSINDFTEKKIESYYNLGSLYKQSGEYKKAIAYFEEANKKQEDFNGANGAIGECYLQLGKWKEAGAYLNKAYQAHPDDKVVLNNLGVMEYSLQHYAAAEKYFGLSVKADACFLDGLKNTAACCQMLNKRQEAMGYYEKAIQCHPEQLALYEALIALYGQTGNTAKSEQYQKMLTERKMGM